MNTSQFIEISDSGKLPDCPKVSVIVLSYAHEKYIHETLESILGQQISFPIEILIGDDCSPDESLDILRRYQKQYPEQIRLFHTYSNQGMRANLMNLHSAIRGEYTAYCEGDDFWSDPLKLQTQVDFLDSHPDYSFCGSPTYLLNMIERSYVLGRASMPLLDKGFDNHEIAIKFLCGELYIRTATICLRSVFLKKDMAHFNELLKGCRFGDIILEYCMALYGKVKFFDTPMATYRIAAGSACSYHDCHKAMKLISHASDRRIKIAETEGLGYLKDRLLRQKKRSLRQRMLQSGYQRKTIRCKTKMEMISFLSAKGKAAVDQKLRSLRRIILGRHAFRKYVRLRNAGLFMPAVFNVFPQKTK